MVKSPSEFGRLMHRVRAGSDGAARQLVDEYGPHILRVVRRKLSRQLRSKFDSVDFVQAVWASFFARRAELHDFVVPGQVAAFLAALAGNKVVDEIRRRFATQKCDVNRERSLDGSAAYVIHELAADQPTPSQILLARELWDRLLEDEEEKPREIVTLRREGNTHDEIAEKVGVSARTVRRVMRRLSDRRVEP